MCTKERECQRARLFIASEQAIWMVYNMESYLALSLIGSLIIILYYIDPYVSTPIGCQ